MDRKTKLSSDEIMREIVGRQDRRQAQPGDHDAGGAVGAREEGRHCRGEGAEGREAGGNGRRSGRRRVARVRGRERANEGAIAEESRTCLCEIGARALNRRIPRQSVPEFSPGSLGHSDSIRLREDKLEGWRSTSRSPRIPHRS